MKVEDRYESFRAEIASRLFDGKDPGAIVSTKMCGDSHLHGEAVTGIETESGQVIYYKPRDCRSTELLGRLTSLIFGKNMVPDQILCDGFAFQKSVKVKNPESDRDRISYYRQLGQLESLFLALGSTDMHRENIVCATDTPVVIDTETLLSSRVEGLGGAGDFMSAYADVFPSYSISAGESMVLPRFYSLHQTSPLFFGSEVMGDELKDAFLDGFVDGYRRIIGMKGKIASILDEYDDMPIRYLLRSTVTYAMISFAYRTCKSDDERSAVLKRLEKGMSKSELERWKNVLTWERDAMIEGDIPYFSLCIGSSDLYGDVGKKVLIPRYLEKSPKEYAIFRMEKMGERDLSVQCAYIRASLCHADGWTEDESASHEDVVPEPLEKDVAVSEVEETLKRLWSERIVLPEGALLFHVPMIQGRMGSLFGLAEGFPGVGVFLHECASSSIMGEGARRMALDMAGGVFTSMCLFAEHLLSGFSYGTEERTLKRLFGGTFDIKDGLAGFLWSLERMKNLDENRSERILCGFRSWNIDFSFPEHRLYEASTEELDILECGRAALAASLLESNVEEAGIILARVYGQKKNSGCYRIFEKGRREYFLPAFLRGSTGIAYVMLHYAEKLAEKGK